MPLHTFEITRSQLHILVFSSTSFLLSGFPSNSRFFRHKCVMQDIAIFTLPILISEIILNWFRNSVLYFPFRKIVLRGHESRRPVPVCNICYKALTFCGEIIDSPSTLQSQTTAESIQVDEN